MKWLIMIAFWFLYWGICFLCTGGDKKNLMGLRSYPKAVQEQVREQLPKAAPKEKSIPSILLQPGAFHRCVFPDWAGFPKCACL